MFRLIQNAWKIPSRECQRKVMAQTSAFSQRYLRLLSGEDCELVLTSIRLSCNLPYEQSHSAARPDINVFSDTERLNDGVLTFEVSESRILLVILCDSESLQKKVVAVFQQRHREPEGKIESGLCYVVATLLLFILSSSSEGSLLLVSPESTFEWTLCQDRFRGPFPVHQRQTVRVKHLFETFPRNYREQ